MLETENAARYALFHGSKVTVKFVKFAPNEGLHFTGFFSDTVCYGSSLFLMSQL